ncbi:MAG: polysaccharide biosynthesis tyrosine autokinase [Acutalibacteraceae bacterium]|nr:polysaccharide biosynthesis tyrosine autokinase [Acutalibacteraceae bacterium]
MKEFKSKQMNLFILLRDVLFNWWVIILAGVIGFSSCQVYYTGFSVNTYTSSMTIAVNLSGYTNAPSTTSLSRAIEIATAFQNVLQSSALVEVVEEQIGEKITGEFTAKQISETNLIDLSVTDANPTKAYKTLKSIYNNYSLLTDNAFNNVIISVLSYPNMPTSIANKTRGIFNSLFVAVFCMALCTAIILLISYFRDTVKNVDDVENLLDCKLFGTVEHINKHNKKSKNYIDALMINNPLVNYKFSNSIREIAIKIESLQRTRNIKSVMITSLGENEGKTTISVNVAIALADNGKKVALVDCDLKLPAVYKFFNDKNEDIDYSLTDYLSGNASLDSVTRYDKRTGLYLIGGNKKTTNSSEIVSKDNFKDLIKKLEDEYDVVVIDTPPGGVAVDAEIISEITSATFLVVKQDCVPVENINDYISGLNSQKLLGCIFNDVHSFSQNNYFA